MSTNHGQKKLRLVGALALGAYPLLIYVGVTTWSPRATGLMIAGCALVLVSSRLWRAPRKQARSIVLPFLPALGIGLSAGAVNDGRFLLALPALISASLFVPFAGSLRLGSTPMVERFALLHLQRQALTYGTYTPDRAHCRRFTWAWSVFLLLNTLCAGTLAVLSLVDWWLAYACGISYLLMGALFGIERLMRPGKNPGPASTMGKEKTL